MLSEKREAGFFEPGFSVSPKTNVFWQSAQPLKELLCDS
jgi:hypothetical protein